MMARTWMDRRKTTDCIGSPLHLRRRVWGLSAWSIHYQIAEPLASTGRNARRSRQRAAIRTRELLVNCQFIDDGAVNFSHDEGRQMVAMELRVLAERSLHPVGNDSRRQLRPAIHEH